MNYIKIEKDNLLNGPGIRAVLWLAGCDRKCNRCHNPETWNPESGLVFDDNARKELLDILSQPHCSGLTLTGGDPFFHQNRFELLILLNEIRTEFPEKNIWCWTGHTIEELIPNFENLTSIEGRILSNIDVLIDGKFEYKTRENDLTDPNHIEILKYRGSSNQRIINVQKSLEKGKVIIYG